MSMMWFGTRYPAPLYDDSPQTETPVGRECEYCDELIAVGDDGVILVGGTILHRECNFRMIIGSVAHQEKRCSCFGGNAAHDDGMTRREGARAALEYAVRR
jgi:hypothetical protein